MNCPTCKEVTLVLSERQGVEIDYCPQCRGIWLDRGELDKIIERSERELAGAQPPAPQPYAPPPAPQPYPAPAATQQYGWGSDCDDGYRQGPHGGYRKKSFLKDIFD